MALSIDAIQTKLFSRPAPVLEPGTKVWDKALTKDIEGLEEHRFVIAGELLQALVSAVPSGRHELVRLARVCLILLYTTAGQSTLSHLTSALRTSEIWTVLTVALHLANDDIHHAHLIAQDSEGVSLCRTESVLAETLD